MRHVFDDGGRASAGFDGKCGDCVVRAIAIASGIPYAEVYKACAEINATRRNGDKVRSARNGMRVQSAPFRRYMQSLGFVWTPTMRIGQGCKVHLRDGEIPMGRLIVAVSKHYTAVIDGVIYDRFDPSRDGTRCVYGYWTYQPGGTA